MREYWVDRKQIIGVIGTVFIIFGVFLPVYTLNLSLLNQVSISIIDIPLMGKPVAFILIAMGFLSILAMHFGEYKLLYISGLVSLFAVLTTLLIVATGLVILSANLPRVFAVVNDLFDYDFGWIFLFAGSIFLLVTPKIAGLISDQ